MLLPHPMLPSLCNELLPLGTCRNLSTHLYSLRGTSFYRPLRICCSLQNLSTKAEPDASAATASYLMDSLGLSSKEALSLSNRLQLRTTENSDSVLRFLKDHGFTRTQIAKIIARRPSYLNANPERSFKPKLDFFRGLGFSGPTLTTLFTSNHDLFSMSLEKKIMPSVDFLRSIVKTPKGVADAIRFTTGTILDDQNPNFKILKDIGVPDSNISRLLVTLPRALLRSPDQFSETVAKVKGMGLDPSSMMFLRIVSVMSYTSKAALERKHALYRSLGWSDCEILTSIRKNPHCLAVSDSGIQQKLEFFYTLGLSPAFISARPQMLLFSFKKRIVPRSMVFEKLKSRGLVKADEVLITMLQMAEKDFVEKFVTKYEEEIPELVKAHQV